MSRNTFHSFDDDDPLLTNEVEFAGPVRTRQRRSRVPEQRNQKKPDLIGFLPWTFILLANTPVFIVVAAVKFPFAFRHEAFLVLSGIVFGLALAWLGSALIMFLHRGLFDRLQLGAVALATLQIIPVIQLGVFYGCQLVVQHTLSALPVQADTLASTLLTTLNCVGAMGILAVLIGSWFVQKEAAELAAIKRIGRRLP